MTQGLNDAKSGIGDSNPGRLVGSQESCHWTNPASDPRLIRERKERELNPQGSSLARVRIGCRRRSACPSLEFLQSERPGSEAPAGGIEPPIVALTRRRLTVRLHRSGLGRPVGMAGFEPAISCSRCKRISQAFPHPESSAQQELNPHVRHGKAVGYRSIMGTRQPRRIVKENQSTGWDSNPRRRITGAESSPLDDQCRPTSDRSGTRGARTLTTLVKSQTLCH
jgi:hypothetical protein